MIATKVGIDDLIAGNGATATDLEQLERIETWPVLAPEARYGLLGRLVDELASYSEADPVGLLGHAIAGLGNLIIKGRAAFNVELIVVGMLAIGLVGSVLNRIAARLEARALRWRPQR